jgi:hypothetical protein
MKYEAPDYHKLYHAECESNKLLWEENDRLQATLRDHFAMAALTGMFAADTEDCFLGINNEILRARGCYKMADAMMAARKEQP